MLQEKINKPVHWSTQGGELNITHISKVVNILHILYATNSITWYFHVYDFQGKHNYDIILGCDKYPELKI